MPTRDPQGQPQSARKTAGRSRLRRRLGLAAAAAAVGLAAAFGGWQLLRASVDAPTEEALRDPWHRAHRVLARDGRVLRERPSDAGLRGTQLDLEAIGPRLVQATLTSEDREFFTHDGVDRAAIARAALQSARHRRMVSGASTITQQLVKLVDNRGGLADRTLGMKLREVARAQNLEEVLEKPAILEAYVNRLPYGHGLVGPEAAAQGYFGVRARDLSWAQAAFLAVLPRAPSYLDPYRHPERVRLRQAALLDALHEEGHLTDEEHRAATSEPIALKELEHPFLAPHLVDALIAEGALERDVDEANAATRTTLDLDLQRDVEGLVRTRMAALADKGATDAAALVVDNLTGEVLAYVGSADFHDPEISGQVDMIRAPRQPGSTLKPFVYALALAHGHRASEALADVATRFEEAGGTYTPVNFSRGYDGPISLREALAGSLNVPAVRLAAELEHGELLRFLRALGLTSLDQPPEHYGLALALGGGEVRLRELAEAYVALARGGERIPLRLTVDDAGALGEPVPEGSGERLLDPGVAAQIAEILSDPLARVRGLHGRGPFGFGYPVAIKTGTSSGYRDTWTVGFTRERTVAVWVGNADGSGTASLTGASGAGYLFADVMRRVMDDVASRAPLWEPELLASVEVCPLSGAPAGPACPERVRRYEIRPDAEGGAETGAETDAQADDHGHHRAARADADDRGLERAAQAEAEEPEGPEPCAMHVHVRRDPVAPSGWRCDPRGRDVAVVLDEAYEEWLLAYGPPATTGADGQQIPWIARSGAPGCDADDGAELPTLRVVAPATGAVLLLDSRGGPESQVVEIDVAVEPASRAAQLGELEILIDGDLVARTSWPHRVTAPITAGDHEITARPADPRRFARIRPSQFSVR
ncbi:MAG: penicillin-binding protein 1C [Nannocystaceae bacterium]